MKELLHWFDSLWKAATFLVVFTIVFILLDEYVAKPIRLRRLEKRRKHDPVVREALETAERVDKLRKQRGHE